MDERRYESTGFSIAAPAGWSRVDGPARLTLIDGAGGTIMVSSARVTPKSESEILSKALANAFDSVRRTAANPDLLSTRDLGPTPHPTLRCWTAEARTRDAAVWFSQAVLASADAVILVTVETGTPEGEHRRVFHEFVSAICVDADADADA
jgi:hypothetical protein